MDSDGQFDAEEILHLGSAVSGTRGWRPRRDGAKKSAGGGRLIKRHWHLFRSTFSAAALLRNEAETQAVAAILKI